MSDGAKSKKHLDGGELGGFQAAVLLVGLHRAATNVSSANMAFDTAAPGSELLKSFSVPDGCALLRRRPNGYDFAFYFGPNKYADPEESRPTTTVRILHTGASDSAGLGYLSAG